MEKLEFAKFYDITEFAKAHNMLYDEDSYIKIYICVDTHTFWIARILDGFNKDYEPENGVMLLERNNIEKDFKSQGIESIQQLIDVLEEDDLSNWDFYQVNSVEEAIEDYLDNGFGMGEFSNKDKEKLSSTIYDKK